jgi:hypothetical protein
MSHRRQQVVALRKAIENAEPIAIILTHPTEAEGLNSLFSGLKQANAGGTESGC